MAGPTNTDQVTPATTTNSSRVIPGLSSQPTSTNSTKRSRKKKTGSKVEDSNKTAASIAIPESSPVIDPNPVPPINSELEPQSGITPASASGSVSPVQQVQKRIRAATKKLQRICGYESSAGPLNEDQKRAIASKPALEATVKELQDLLKILEEDERLDELRIQAVREEEELKVQGRVDSAVETEQKKAESNLKFLFQFLHLYSIVNSITRPTESFAPPIVPPVIQNATAQELAAVSALFHRLAEVSNVGGTEDALVSVNEFTQGSELNVIEGVTFARIKEMAIQSTASPAETTSHSHKTGDAPKIDEESSQINNQSGSIGNMMFLQQSEVVPTVSLSHAESKPSVSTPDQLHQDSTSVEKEPQVDHVARNKQLLEQATILGGDPNSSSANGWSNGEQASAPQLDGAPSTAPEEWTKPPEHLSATQAEVVARTIDWAEDVQGQGEGQNRHPTGDYSSIHPPSAHGSGELLPGQVPLGPPHHHLNNGRGNYRGRGGGYRGGPGAPRGGGNADGYRGGRGWYRGNPGYRGGRGGPPAMDMNGSGGWRPGPGGPPDANGGYRPRGDYSGGRYGGHRGGPRGGNAFHRPHQPPAQVYHPEVAAGPGGGNMY